MSHVTLLAEHVWCVFTTAFMLWWFYNQVTTAPEKPDDYDQDSDDHRKP